MSDGLLRTDEQIFEEMFERLGYGRRGHRITEALYRAIAQAKNSGAAGVAGSVDVPTVRGAVVPIRNSGRAEDPRLPRGRPIDEHNPNGLVQLVDWITSDGCRRTDGEILDEMYVRLGYVHRDAQTSKALRAAIGRARYLSERYGTL